MSDTAASGTTPPGIPTDDPLAETAVELAQRWVHTSADVPADAAAQRLAGVLRDPNGLPFTIGFVDGVMRPESVTAAANRLHHVAPLVPEFLPWYLRGAVRIGGAVAPVLPTPVVPIARTALREMVGHLVVDARPHKLGPGGHREGDVVEADAVLREGVVARRHGAQPEQPARHLVDHPAEQEPQLLTGLLVGIGGQLEGHLPAEHGVVEAPRRLDVPHGEPHVAESSGGDGHAATVAGGWVTDAVRRGAGHPPGLSSRGREPRSAVRGR